MSRQRRRLLGIATVVSTLTVSVFGQHPVIESFSPRGGVPGTTVAIRLVGEYFDGPVSWISDSSSINFVGFAEAESEALTVRLQIEPDCPLDSHAGYLHTKTGISEIQMFHVGPFPQMKEQEPNNEGDEPNLVNLGTTVEGAIENGDFDHFQLNLKQGERLIAEVQGMRLGKEFFDPHLQIHGPNGAILATNDDSRLLKQDATVGIIAQEPGNYTVVLREAAFGGSQQSEYRLHLGSFPRPLSLYPAGGQIGTVQTFHCLDVAGVSFEFEFTLPNQPDTKSAIWVSNANGQAPTPNWIHVSAFPDVHEVEPNGKPDSTTTPMVALPIVFNGRIGQPNDTDYFLVEAPESAVYQFTVFAADLGSRLDSVLTVSQPDGTLIAQNDDWLLHDSRCVAMLTKGNRYQIGITDQLGRGGDDFVYRIQAEPIAPSLNLSLAGYAAASPQRLSGIALPRGSRIGLVITAKRSGFFDPVTLLSENLPPGVSMVVPEIEYNSHITPVLFEASPDAALTSRAIGIRGVAHTKSGEVAGELLQTVALVTGAPRNTIYHGTQLKKLPIAIVDKAPFTLEVESPSIALLQDGLLPLKVRATRKAGFEEGIRLSLGWQPPWIEEPEVINIEPEATEATYTIRAESEATPRQWRIFMNGQASIDGQTIEYASSFFDISIETPYLNIELGTVTADQGETVILPATIEYLRPLPATAKLRLLGLPKFAESAMIEITPEISQVDFMIQVGEETPVSIHNTLYVEVVIPQGSDHLLHYAGRTGTLKVNVPGTVRTGGLSPLDLLRQRHPSSTPFSETEPLSATKP